MSTKSNSQIPYISYFFSYSYVATLFFLFLESFTFSGFIAKYLLIDVPIVATASFVFLIWGTYRQIKNKQSTDLITKEEKLLLLLNRLLLLPVGLIYIIVNNIEAEHYPNYVYSEYHIHPNALLRVLLYVLLITAFRWFITDYFKQKDSFIKRYFSQLQVFELFLLFALGPMFFSSFNTLIRDYADSRYLAVNWNTPVSERMFDQRRHTEKMAWVAEYSDFINSQTESTDTIMLPPNIAPWLSTGNELLMRWFLYPRNVVKGELIANNFDAVDHVLIAHGLWTDGYEHELVAWPKETIESKLISSISYLDRDSSNVSESTASDYQISEKEKWGIISFGRE